MRFAGKSVLVTGATSGIGAAVARAFSAEGAKVLATSRDPARGVAMERELGDGAVFLPGDVTDPRFADSAVEGAVRHHGGLDILVNSAGVIHIGDVEQTSDADWLRVISVNLSGPFYISRAAVRQMRRQGGGNIVNIGSDYSLMAGPGTVAYCASKGGLLQLTKAMALDHAREKIRLNIVCPTTVDTPMIDQLARERGRTPEEARRVYAEYVPTRELVMPDDVAKAVLFLASDDARHVTGTALSVDGGTTAQ